MTAGLLGRKHGPVGFWAKATQGLPVGHPLGREKGVEMKIWVW